MAILGSSIVDGKMNVYGDIIVNGKKVITDSRLSELKQKFARAVGGGSFSLTAKELNGITQVRWGCFRGHTGLTSISIPATVQEIKTRAFQNCTNLQRAILSNSISIIGNYVFYNCTNLTTIGAIPSSLTTLGTQAFYGCTALTGDLSFPNTLTRIESETFDTCRGITSITLGNAVTYIGDYAFYRCSGLTKFTIRTATPPTLANAGAFSGTTCDIYVPYSSDHSVLNAYKTATNWSTYASRIKEI